MRVVLHEWACAVGPGPGDDPAGTIAAEGRAMLRALVCDAARDPTLDVTVLLAEGRHARPDAVLGAAAGRPRVCRVPAGAEIDVLCAESARADWTLIVAPETDVGTACGRRRGNANSGRLTPTASAVAPP